MIIDNGTREEIIVPGIFRGVAGVEGRLTNGGEPRRIGFFVRGGATIVAGQIPVGTPILLGAEPYRVTSTTVSEAGIGAPFPFVAMTVSRDLAPRSSHPAAIELSGDILESLADFICGDADEYPVRRAGPDLTRFFASAGLPRFMHDGSTRKWWTLAALRQCTPDELIGVLLQLASPQVYRGDRDKIACALDQLNACLQLGGLRLYHEGITPCAERVRPGLAASTRQPGDITHTAILAAFDVRSVQDAWEKALRRREDDPAGAIASARTLLEEICKTILDRRNEAYGAGMELPQLFKKVISLLRFAPDPQTEQLFNQLLGNCQGVVGAIAAIRNKYGDAHGRGKHSEAEARHADLAVNLAGAMGVFLVSTYLSTNTP